MTPSFNLLLTVCFAYAAALFFIAYLAERSATRGHMRFLRSPLIYTLSLSVYCTAWTYYGAVGSAARNGLEFVTIYLGPTLVFIGWWWLLRKLVQVGRAQRVTSIADLISSRYGKSASLAVVATLLAVIGTTPYIALQLQSLTRSFAIFAGDIAGPGGYAGSPPADTLVAFWMAVGLAMFTIIFGTRNIDANERHHGVVTAIAVEAIVKLVALLAVGVFVVWSVANGPEDIFSRMPPDMIQGEDVFSSRWVTLIFLSATAIICLPRMFQVIVVENVDERHLATASWAFPLYLFLMSLFVLPIAIAGLSELPAGSNPDLFVVTVPLSKGQDALAILAFLGGFSAATSMVIVASIALSTMISNHIVMPLWLRMGAGRVPASDDVRSVLLRSRRISIVCILALGYIYFQLTGGGSALASIGLIAFLGVAQVLPALLGGLFWSGATRKGAMAGIVAGFLVWGYSLFLPSLGPGFELPAPFTPHALLGLTIEDPLIHAVVWSLGINTLALVVVSLCTTPTPAERLQAHHYIKAPERASGSSVARTATSEELLILAQRILGRDEGISFFNKTARAQGKLHGLPSPTEEFIADLERKFAGSVGAATANAMIGQIATGEALSFEDMIAVADETAQIMEYSSRLEAQSKALKETADQLRTANQKLTALSAQKDTFLSQVSHELRTPMTSIRSFSEILRDSDTLDDQGRARFSSIIHDESIRLTRLLDDILDLSFLENGRIRLNIASVSLGSVLDLALTATESLRQERNATIERDTAAERHLISTDGDRLAQVFINLITNAIRHGAPPDCAPRIKISCHIQKGMVEVMVSDYGTGIAPEHIELIFEKFSKLGESGIAGSAGLGLPISREIMRNLGGSLEYMAERNDSETGAAFKVTIPLAN
ncbi:MAG: ATP-binding protein [Pikeienuella sp.]